MAQKDEYTKYALLAQLERDAQNPQDLAAMWGDITNECEEVGVTIEHAFAALGQYDFIVIVEAPSRDRMLEASLILSRYDLDVQTLDVFPTEQFADIVQDV